MLPIANAAEIFYHKCNSSNERGKSQVGLHRIFSWPAFFDVRNPAGYPVSRKTILTSKTKIVEKQIKL